MPWASFSMLDGPGGTVSSFPLADHLLQCKSHHRKCSGHHQISGTAVPPGPSSIENDAHGTEKLLLKTQVS